jgi:hypothetical protein
MPKGSKTIFDELERNVPFPYGQISKHEKSISNKGSNISKEELVRGQGIVLKEKIRKAKSY